MNQRFAVEPSPVAGLLRRLQTSAGWGGFVTDDLKRRMIRQLDRIAMDDDVPPQTQIAAIACTIRASSLELEAVNTMTRLYEVTELERRIDDLTRRLEPVTVEPDFVSLVELDDDGSCAVDDTGSRADDDTGPAPDGESADTSPAPEVSPVKPEPVRSEDRLESTTPDTGPARDERESVGFDDLFDD